MMKVCFKCHVKKHLREFYRHSQMADGRFGKCKNCARKDVNAHRIKNIDRIRDNDRKRGNRQTSEYRSSYGKRYRRERPIAYVAGLIALNAIRRGEIKRQPCVRCGSRITHGHHEDYRKPLELMWLCFRHHKERHAEIKQLGIDLHYK